MSNPDPLTAWAGEPAPGLTLGDCLHRIGHCAHRIDDGEPCPDHPETEDAS